MDKLISWTPFGDARMPWRTLFSYLFDYAIIVILAVAYAALDKLVTPFNQPFSLNDITIQYPFAEKERIPIAEAIVIACGFPLVVIAVYTLVVDGIFSHDKQHGRKKYTFKDRLWELNCGILGLFLAHGTAFCITGTLKNLIGRPRPDLIDRCIPLEGALASLPPFTLSTSAICTQKVKAIMQDGFRSFPSGHSSSAFAGLFYLSLYLSGKLHITDQRGEVWRTVLVIVPTAAAACIAASRIMDARHHAFDVLFGSALGLLCGWASYRQYFPPLSQSWLKGRAYPMRDWGVKIRQAPSSEQYYAEDRAPLTRHDRTAGIAMSNDRDTEYLSPYPTAHQYSLHQANDSTYGLEPMRPRLPARPGVSPGFENTPVVTPGSVDETEYEHVRPKTAAYSARPAPPGAPATGDIGDGNVVMLSQKGQTPTGNAFREQVASNQSRRKGTFGSDGEDDTRHTRPTHLSSGMGKPI